MKKSELLKLIKEELQGFSPQIGKTKGLTTDTLNKILKKIADDTEDEEVTEKKRPGLWANINAKKKRGEKASHGNSNAHKDAVAAGNAMKKEGMFSTSFDGEQDKVEKALDRWVKYSMENGDSEADVMSVGEKYLKDSIHAYIGGNIDDEDLLKRYDDTMSKVNKKVYKR